VVSAGVAAAVLLVGAGVGEAVRMGLSPAPSLRHRPIVNAAVVCPGFFSSASQAETTFSVATPSTQTASAPTVSSPPATLAELTGARKVRHTHRESNTMTALRIPGGSAPPLVGRVAGALAAGFTVQQVTEVTGSQSRELSGVSCAKSDNEFWFLGASGATSHRDQLHLINGESSQAQVDVDVYGPNGSIDTSLGQGVLLAPGERKTLFVTAMAPDTPVVALHVRSREGRLATAVYDQETEDGASRGGDWLPATASPSRRLTVPGIPNGVISAQLFLLPLAGNDGVVKLKLISTSGAFVPAGLETVPVSENEVTSVELGSVLRGEPAAVVIDSDVPVVAGMRITRGSGEQSPEIAYLAAVPALEGPATVVGNRTDDSFSATLLLSAPGSAAQVRVTPLAADAAGGEVVQVAAGATSVVMLKPASGTAPYAVVVAPLSDSGPVYGARLLAKQSSERSLLTVQPLISLPTTVALPEVTPNPSAGTQSLRQ